MWRAALVHVDGRPGPAAQERSRRAGVVEMDVCEQYRAHVGHRHAAALELREERRQRTCRTRIHDRDALDTVKKSGGDDLRTVEEHQIYVVEPG